MPLGTSGVSLMPFRFWFPLKDPSTNPQNYWISRFSWGVSGPAGQLRSPWACWAAGQLGSWTSGQLPSEAARHQWSVSNPWDRFPVLGSQSCFWFPLRDTRMGPQNSWISRFSWGVLGPAGQLGSWIAGQLGSWTTAQRGSKASGQQVSDAWQLGS